MGQLKRIVVGHDLKTGGETALKSAVVLAGRCNAALRLVHVVEPHHLYQRISHPMASKNNLEEIVQQAGRKLQEVIASWELAHLRVEYEVHMGKPFVEIILAARAWRADLIVVGGPCPQQSHFLGSNAERVVRKAPVPVLVARKPLDAKAKCFLVPTDFSSGAQKAAKEALVLARSFGGRIFFLHVLDLTPLYAYGSGGDIAASLPMLKLTPEDFETDWEFFLSSLVLEKIAWEKHPKRVVLPRRLLSVRKQFMRMQSSWVRMEEAVLSKCFWAAWLKRLCELPRALYSRCGLTRLSLDSHRWTKKIITRSLYLYSSGTRMVMMNNKMMVALVGALSLWSYTPYAMAQNRARADIKNAQGSTVGTASLRETNDGLLVIVNVKGLPEGLHAVHIMRRGSVKVPPL